MTTPTGLSEDSKLFLRAMYGGPAEDDPSWPSTRDALVAAGRDAIIMSIETFLDVFIEEMKSPLMDHDAANIRANIDEAVRYIAPMLGMV